MGPLGSSGGEHVGPEEQEKFVSSSIRLSRFFRSLETKNSFNGEQFVRDDPADGQREIATRVPFA